MERRYGYHDEYLVPPQSTRGRTIHLVFALLLIFLIWFGLNQKLLFGQSWLSETYDTTEWRTNEGNMPTYGAWDLEAHIWKSMFIMENFPHFQWNPYWYLGMPLLEYYQPSFYLVHWAFMEITGLDVAKSALFLIIFAHLLATYLTFLLCYKVSRRIWAAAFCSTFLLTNTFLTLRSYGWEPITVVFLFLYPLGLLFFLSNPLHPFRFSLILILAFAYLSHPLIFFSLCMTMGLYLLFIALKENNLAAPAGQHLRYLWALAATIAVSVLLAAVQALPQLSYHQVTSGAHMGLAYLPGYHVPFNVISPFSFFLDAGNLKGPGPIVLIALFLFVSFLVILRVRRQLYRLWQHELIMGFGFVLFIMVLFYYLERYGIFPMNLIGSVQYHRIIPEFIIAASIVVAGMSTLLSTLRQRIFYYVTLIAFVAACGIIVFNVQEYWKTTDTILEKPEIIVDEVNGRISFPYTDQSLSVRNSFVNIPQVYGYYEQGITNSYADELFSVSSGFHPPHLTLLYLKAANVGRLYVNTEEGYRDQTVIARMNGTLPFIAHNSRYSYFDIPLKDPSLAQAIDATEASAIKELDLGCRTLFKERYCGSIGEEFVTTDAAEIRYLAAYVTLLEKPHPATANITMQDPDHYLIDMTNATTNTAIVVKMTYDDNFIAINEEGKQIPITRFGPDFMRLTPRQDGDYSITLTYQLSTARSIGLMITSITFILLIFFFGVSRIYPLKKRFVLKEGDLS